jgi:hypothetical protein
LEPLPQESGRVRGINNYAYIGGKPLSYYAGSLTTGVVRKTPNLWMMHPMPGQR